MRILPCSPHCLIALLIVVVWAQGSVRSGEVSNLTELREELQAGWKQLKKLDEKAKTYEVNQLVTMTKSGEVTQALVRSEVKVDWANGFRLAHMIKEEVQPRPIVCARNPDYAFVIAEGGSGWGLQGIDRGKPGHNHIDQDVLGAIPMRDIFYPLSSFIFFQVLATDLLKDENFQLTDFKKVPEGKVSAKFSWKFPTPHDNKLHPIDGEMLLNPSLSWVVEEWNYSWNDKKITMTRAVSPPENGSDVIVCRSIMKDFSNEQYALTFENHDFKLDSLEPFRLSYYGLPEPADEPTGQPSSRRWYAWLNAAALGVLGVAILLWALARKSRSKRETSSSAAG